MIDRFERFSYDIFEISRYWHKIASDEMEKFGLKGQHSVYLAAMYRYPEGLTAAQICELCGKDKSDVSRMMSIMEKKGLVKKEGIHQKLYRGTFKLTEQGMEAAKSVCERAQLVVEIAGSEITPHQREVLYETLEHIASKLREMSENGLPPQEA